jgi:hypothetical protein
MLNSLSHTYKHTHTQTHTHKHTPTHTYTHTRAHTHTCIYSFSILLPTFHVLFSLALFISKTFSLFIYTLSTLPQSLSLSLWGFIRECPIGQFLRFPFRKIFRFLTRDRVKSFSIHYLSRAKYPLIPKFPPHPYPITKKLCQDIKGIRLDLT